MQIDQSSQYGTTTSKTDEASENTVIPKARIVRKNIDTLSGQLAIIQTTNTGDIFTWLLSHDSQRVFDVFNVTVDLSLSTLILSDSKLSKNYL